jgi:hypothetical protein
MIYIAEFDASAGPEDNEAGTNYDVLQRDERGTTTLIASQCTETHAARIAAALNAVEGTDTEKIEFLVDSRNKGWELAKSLQSQLNELRDVARSLCQEANSRGRLDPGGCDSNTSVAYAYRKTLEQLGDFA